MLPTVIGETLPAAMAIGLSPIPIVAIVLILGSRRARSNGLSFSFGWIAGMALVSTVVLLLIRDTPEPESATATGINWAQVAFGLLLLVMAARKWRTRPGPDTPAEMPAWMESISEYSPSRSLLLGAALSAANPKNLVLTLSAAATISQAGLTTGNKIVAVAAFVGAASIAVAGLTGFALVAPQRATKPLASVKTFMADNNAVIMMVLLLIFGVQLLGKGLGAIGS